MHRLLYSVPAVLIWATPLLAQAYDAPRLKFMPYQGSILDWLFTAGFLVGCLVVAFLPAKRSNLQ